MVTEIGGGVCVCVYVCGGVFGGVHTFGVVRFTAVKICKGQLFFSSKLQARI